MKLLGHLALTRYPVPSRTESPSHAITFMRHQAELVVKYFERQELDVEGFQWAGVFKPVADVDDSFALAEPPAHDDWVPHAVQDKGRRTDVRVALTRIREAADKYLSPRKPSVASSEAPPSAAHVGDMLADLLGGLEGPAPSTRVAPPNPVDTSSWSSAGTAAPGNAVTGPTPASSDGTATPPPPPNTAHGATGPGSSAQRHRDPSRSEHETARRTPPGERDERIPRPGSVARVDAHHHRCPAGERIAGYSCGRRVGAGWLRRRERGGQRGHPDHRLVGGVGRHICPWPD